MKCLLPMINDVTLIWKSALNRCLANKVCSRSNELLKSVHYHAVNVITGTCLASRLHESPKRLCANENAWWGAEGSAGNEYKQNKWKNHAKFPWHRHTVSASGRTADIGIAAEARGQRMQKLTKLRKISKAYQSLLFIICIHSGLHVTHLMSSSPMHHTQNGCRHWRQGTSVHSPRLHLMHTRPIE